MKPKILFLAEAATLAHVMRPYLLAQSLNPSEFEIFFATDPIYLSLFKKENFKYHQLKSQSPETFQKKLWLNQPVYNFEVLDQYVKTDLEIIKFCQPDLIVSDFRISLALSARLAKVPFACITNSYWTSFYRTRYPSSENIVSAIIGPQIFEKVFNKWSSFFFNQHADVFKSLAKKWNYNLPEPYNVLDLYTDGDLRLFADYPEMVKLKVNSDNPIFENKNHFFMGSFIWSPNIRRPDWWDQLPKDKANVYVNLGSSGQKKALPRVIAALHDLPVNILAATVNEQKQFQQSNLFCERFLPGLETAMRSQLMICNGGSPSTQTSIFAGIPCIGIPSNLDQHLNMQLMEASGLGFKLRSDDIDVSYLKNLVLTILNSTELQKSIPTWQKIAQSRLAQKEFKLFLEQFFSIGKQHSA